MAASFAVFVFLAFGSIHVSDGARSFQMSNDTALVNGTDADEVAAGCFVFGDTGCWPRSSVHLTKLSMGCGGLTPAEYEGCECEQFCEGILTGCTHQCIPVQAKVVYSSEFERMMAGFNLFGTRCKKGPSCSDEQYGRTGTFNERTVRVDRAHGDIGCWSPSYGHLTKISAGCGWIPAEYEGFECEKLCEGVVGCTHQCVDIQAEVVDLHSSEFQRMMDQVAMSVPGARCKKGPSCSGPHLQ
eukprot:TRINITY_DN11607_c0_g1_i1.p1 TRINITY_DN11607_c0_g1~~TRINITY_DN11607_c0_g1_i1.p1  ORF type:complete len:242 (+),score=12.17 TRINITY_DN11607_c0_g1_i1:78-803(+)